MSHSQATAVLSSKEWQEILDLCSTQVTHRVSQACSSFKNILLKATKTMFADRGALTKSFWEQKSREHFGDDLSIVLAISKILDNTAIQPVFLIPTDQYTMQMNGGNFCLDTQGKNLGVCNIIMQ